MTIMRMTLTVLAFCTGVAGCWAAVSGLRTEIAAMLADQALVNQQAGAARKAALRALRTEPMDYRHLRRLALLEEGLARHRRALAHWEAALLRRPSWPYAWAQIARWELQYGSRQEKAVTALTRSALLGDNERGLWRFYATLDLELTNAPQSEAARDFLEERLLREIRDRPNKILGHALLRKSESRVCALMSKDREHYYWCGVADRNRGLCDRPEILTAGQAEHCQHLQETWQQMAY